MNKILASSVLALLSSFGVNAMTGDGVREAVNLNESSAQVVESSSTESEDLGKAFYGVKPFIKGTQVVESSSTESEDLMKTVYDAQPFGSGEITDASLGLTRGWGDVSENQPQTEAVDSSAKMSESERPQQVISSLRDVTISEPVETTSQFIGKTLSAFIW